MTTERALQPRRAPKQPRSMETRDRILSAAAQVFADFGYSAGTTNRIPAAAGLSIGSLYQYFPNKDAILVELSRAHARAGTAILTDRLAHGLPDGLEARLRVAVDATLANHRDQHRLHQVLFEEAPRPPSLLRELHEAENHIISLVDSLFAGDPEVDVRDTTLAARMVVTTVESLVHRFIAREPDTLDVDQFTDELMQMLLPYLRGPGRSRPDRASSGGEGLVPCDCSDLAVTAEPKDPLMGDKSPKKNDAKKPSKSIKEKRADKHAKRNEKRPGMGS